MIRRRGPVVGWLSVLALLAACGDGGGDAGGGLIGPGDRASPDEVRSGTVQLENRTAYAIEVAYLHVDLEGERVYRVEIAAGVTAPISAGELPAGTQVEFVLVLQVPVGEGMRVRRRIQVRVDGDQTVVADLGDGEDPFSLVVTT